VTVPLPPELSPELSPDPPCALADALRAAVLEVAERGPRRVFAPTISVGDPTGHHASYVDRSCASPARVPGNGRTDHGLRTDVVSSLLATALRPDVAGALPIAWLARPAAHEDPDCERDWLAAATAAFAELGVPLVFVVVTRHGWWDPRSGASRSWRRVRPRH
jgi:hypothetical protein